MRIYFVVLYLLVDILYVGLSSSTYNRAILGIQGAAAPGLRGTRAVAAVIAWGTLLLGWAVFAAPKAIEWSKRMRPWAAGAAAGAIYGAALYGVFNGTLHAMLSGWGTAIAVRDFLWGTLWGAALTAMYAHTSYKMQKER